MPSAASAQQLVAWCQADLATWLRHRKDMPWQDGSLVLPTGFSLVQVIPQPSLSRRVRRFLQAIAAMSRRILFRTMKKLLCWSIVVQWPCDLDEWLPQVSGLNGVILRVWRFDSWSSCWVSQSYQLQRSVPGQAGNFAESVAGHHQPLELFANGNLYRFDMPMFRSGQIESYISESGETRRRGQAMWCTVYLHRAPAWVSPGLDFQWGWRLIHSHIDYASRIQN